MIFCLLDAGNFTIGDTAGVVVGVFAFIVIIIVASVCAVYRKRRRQAGIVTSTTEKFRELVLYKYIY